MTDRQFWSLLGATVCTVWLAIWMAAIVGSVADRRSPAAETPAPPPPDLEWESTIVKGGLGRVYRVRYGRGYLIGVSSSGGLVFVSDVAAGGSAEVGK